MLYKTEFGTPEREKVFEEFLIENINNSYTKSALAWFKLNLNKIVTSEEFAQITGQNGKPISHNIRRIFELRDEQGYKILNHKTNNDLLVNQWMLTDMEPDIKKVRSRGVTKKITTEVFMRDGNQCQFCGRTPDDTDLFSSDIKIKLHVGHIKPHKENIEIEDINNLSSDDLTTDDFITMCNVCNEGLSNNEIPKYLLTNLDKIKTLVKKLSQEELEELRSFVGKFFT